MSASRQVEYRWFGEAALRAAALAGSAAITIASASVAHAAILTPGVTNVSPDVFAPLSGSATLVASVSGPLTSVVPNDFTGTYHEWVYKDPNNTFGSGDLTWILTVSNDASSKNDMEHVTASSFSGFMTDVGYIGGSGGVVPQFVDRATAPVIAFDFKTPGKLLAPGTTTSFLEIQTNARNWSSGYLSAINEGTATVRALAPSAIPEASTWAMMALGFAGLGCLGMRRSKASRVAFTT
jgi:hypothetical protein